MKGRRLGGKARLASLRRDVSGQLQGRSGVGTLRRLGGSVADRQVSQVETGAAGERCTAGWNSSARQTDGSTQHGMHGGRDDWTLDTGQTAAAGRKQQHQEQQLRGFRGLAPRKETRYAQRNGCHAGKDNDASV